MATPLPASDAGGIAHPRVEEREAVDAGSLKTSAIEGAVASVMTGTSESYMGAFAVALGHSNLHLALLTTTPYLCGAVAQLLARQLVDVLGNRKRLVVTIASLQAVVHIGMIAIALTGTRELLPLLVVNVAYWTCGMAVIPAWNAWMATLTARIDRGRYFSLRSAFAQVGLLTSFAAGGFAMEYGRDHGAVLAAFAVVAGLGGIARTISASLLARQRDPGDSIASAVVELRAPTSLVVRLRAAARESTWGIAFFIVAFQLGANVAIPFFAPYMLNVLHLDFLQFMELYATAMFVKALALPLWNRVGQRIGWRRALFIGTLGTAAVAAGWAFSTSFLGLTLVQALSGASWAGLELSSFQLLLVASPERHRVGFFALSTSMTAVAQVTGSLLGSAVLALSSTYPAAFVGSAVLRALAVVWLIVPATLLARKDT